MAVNRDVIRRKKVNKERDALRRQERDTKLQGYLDSVSLEPSDDHYFYQKRGVNL